MITLDLQLFEKYLHPDEDMIRQVERCCASIQGQKVITDAMEYARSHFFAHRSGTVPCGVMQGVREYMDLTGQDSRTIYAVFLAWILPQSLELLRSQGIPEAYILDNLQDFANWANNYKTYHNGETGFDNLGWMITHFSGYISKIGRLQYAVDPFPFPYVIYRSSKTGEVVAIAQAGLKVTADGFIAGTAHYPDKAAFTTAFTVENGKVTGHPADTKTARILEAPVTLELAEFQPIAMPGSQVINLHIPEAESFAPHLIDESLAKAKEFFDERGFCTDLFVCSSWLLDYQLTTITDPGSNVRSFMERFQKLPISSGGLQILERVMAFDFTMDQLDGFVCKTSMQRRLKSRLQEGGRFFNTAGFLLM